MPSVTEGTGSVGYVPPLITTFEGKRDSRGKGRGSRCLLVSAADFVGDVMRKL